jgi:hypothetical protein
MNRLSGATSLYLQQHAANPVAWWEWGDPAFDAARAADVPVLLSIGYSACHWCHVMAHESFEDPTVAAEMNRLFVCIKVDREERPDVDAVYMDAVQAMTGHGGWPLTVFLTPKGEPFYGGTYFPPQPRGGMPGFVQVLEAVASAWQDRRGDIERSAASLTEAVGHIAVPPPGTLPDAAELLDESVRRLVAAADPVHGGFGRAPKFPSPTLLWFLLGWAARRNDEKVLAVVTAALDGMAAGGIRDQLAGGFHRYSVDAAWAVPHFEKMLYDNAQLARLYCAAWQVTGTALYRDVATATADYLLAELRDGHGAFQATQDADTAKGEGATFVWTPAEVRAVLPPEVAEVAIAWYGITPNGNHEGATVLSARRTSLELAGGLGLTEDELAERLARAAAGLRRARAERVQPATDPKVITAWNGLAIDALARLALAVRRPDYLAAAVAAGRFLVDSMSPGGELAHSWADGRTGTPGFLDDLAAFAGGCISLYEATFDDYWLGQATTAVDTLLSDFAAPDGGFFRSGVRHERLVARQMDLLDAAVPSGNGLAAAALLRLGGLTGRASYFEVAERTLLRAGAVMAEAPSGGGALLSALDDWASGVREVAVIGPRGRDDTEALFYTLHASFRPGLVVAWASGAEDLSDAAVPLLAGRSLVAGRAAAYVCRRQVCQAPVTEPAALIAALG